MMKRKYRFMRFGKGVDFIQMIFSKKPISNVGGKLTSRLFPSDLLFVVGDKYCEEGSAAALCHIRENNISYIAMTYEVYYGVLRGEAQARFTLLHEIGHFVHKDMNAMSDTDSLSNLRMVEVENGRVLPMELAADNFAASYLGRKAALAGLESICNEMRTLGNEYEITVKELELRLRYMKEQED